MRNIKFIKKLKRRGRTDEEILSEIIKQNEEKRSIIEKAEERGATATDIVDEILRQNKVPKKRFFQRLVIKREKDLKKIKKREMASLYSDALFCYKKGDLEMAKKKAKDVLDISGEPKKTSLFSLLIKGWPVEKKAEKLLKKIDKKRIK